MHFLRRVMAFFEPDSTWERPVPAGGHRRDLRLVAGYLVLASALLELARSVAPLTDVDVPTWQQHGLVWLALLPLAVRRRFPVAAMITSHIVLIGLSLQLPVLAAMWSTQVASAVAIFSCAAWARDRRLFLMGLSAITLLNMSYGAYSFALGSAFSEFQNERDATGSSGILPPLPAYVIYWVMMNLVFILASAVGGQLAWRTARQRAQLRTQNVQLLEQADTIREQAQVQERLRIARELHDVVAHHISVIGVQAAGARRVLRRNRVEAEQAMTVIEESSRQAVTEMRSLLGTLRAHGSDRSAAGATAMTDEESARWAPDPTAADIASLVHETVGLTTTYTEVGDAAASVADIPPGVGLALYRTVQESLANVRRHSTAVAADVTLRVGADQSGSSYAEVEVLDEGRPRRNTSGTGLGLLGVRERIGSLGGSSEIGPRATGGYRVRIRFPIHAERTYLQVV